MQTQAGKDDNDIERRRTTADGKTLSQPCSCLALALDWSFTPLYLPFGTPSIEAILALETLAVVSIEFACLPRILSLQQQALSS